MNSPLQILTSPHKCTVWYGLNCCRSSHKLFGFIVSYVCRRCLPTERQ